MKKQHKQVNNLVVVSDLHCGCQAGLCPSSVHLDEGGVYLASKAQHIVWQWWEEFWGEWVPDVCKGEPFAVCVNGDALDGRHHGAVTQISQNLADQQAIAYQVLAPIMEKCDGRMFLVRGTEAHEGQSGEQMELLGKRLGVAPREGRYTLPELRIRVGGKGTAHIMHHIRTTGSSAYEATAINKELTEMYVEAGRWGREPYDAVVRSHRHRCAWVGIPSGKGMAVSVVTPGWQLKTPFAYRIPGGRQSQPQFGGIVLRQGDEDFFMRAWVKSIDPPDEVQL